MLDFSAGLISSSVDAAAAAEAPESGGGSSSDAGGVHFGEEDGAARAEGGGGGGNRWPRQETVALLKIRTDMDAAFRDSSHKAPLWEEVSRKMAEMGYRRSSKKCKEKFENVYKYHKRTKDGRAYKSDGKSYRFFDQLEAFGNNNSTSHPPRPPPPLTTLVAPPSPGNNIETNIAPVSVAAAGQATVLSTQNPFGAPNPIHSPPFPPPPPPPEAATTAANVFPSHRNNSSASLQWDPTSSSSTSSDEDIQRRRRGRKRKRKDFYERLMRDVIEKQEQMQKRFLEMIETREVERVAREEAWRAQEMTRITRDHDLLVQERSMAAAKDAAVIKLLQTIAEQHNIQLPTTSPAETQPPPPPPPQAAAASAAPPQAPPATENNNNSLVDNFVTSMTSSRWPKTEIEALIRIRTNMDTKYQDNGPKGPLWEEVSSEMQKLGYRRNAKRCKEKWENINKYFKKVKESNKKRPEDSKTCPYFHQLEALYKEKAKNEGSFNPLAAENSPIMARPEQQWPPAAAGHNDHNDNEEEDTDDDNDEGGGGYEVLPTPGSAAAATTAATGTAE